MKKQHRKRFAWFRRDSVTVAGAFFLSLAVFTAVLLLPSLLSRLQTNEPAEEEVLGTRGMERSAWVILHDADTLVALLRVYTDTRTMTVRVVGYPPQTEVVSGTAVTTAEAVYRTQGEQVTEYLETDEVLSLSVDHAAALMGEWAGNVSLVLPQAVYALPAGELTVTPLQAAQLLRFTEWEQGMVGQAAVAAELTAAVLTQVLTPTADLAALFGASASVSDTSLHISQYAAVCEDLEELAKNHAKDFCTAQVITGYTVGIDGDRRYVVEKR